MAANTNPIFPLTPRVEGVEFANADGTTKKLLLQPGEYGTRVNKIAACSTDTASATLMFYYSKDAGTTFVYLGSATINAGAESDILAGIKIADIVSGLALPYGSDLYVAPSAAVTSGCKITVTASGGDY